MNSQIEEKQSIGAWLEIWLNIPFNLCPSVGIPEQSLDADIGRILNTFYGTLDQMYLLNCHL